MTALPLRQPINPLHAILLGFPTALFVSAAIADLTYLRTAEIQWTNFAAWLNAGGLLFGAPVVVWAAVGLLRVRSRGASLIYFALLAAMWIVGFITALIHGRDAWYSVTGFGAALSFIAAILAIAAAWIGHRGFVGAEHS